MTSTRTWRDCYCPVTAGIANLENCVVGRGRYQRHPDDLTRKPTGWNRPLIYPLTLRDGTRITTLRQAATLMKGLPETRKWEPVWQHAADLLVLAHKNGKAADVRVATYQLRRALQVEGWM